MSGKIREPKQSRPRMARGHLISQAGYKRSHAIRRRRPEGVGDEEFSRTYSADVQSTKDFIESRLEEEEELSSEISCAVFVAASSDIPYAKAQLPTPHPDKVEINRALV